MRVQKADEVLELGAWMGRKQAFASLAGGCSAADAECLRQMRDHKRYRALGLTWKEFCQQKVGITRQWADQVIRRLEEFGPQYFRLAQATGISAEEYRRIAGALVERGGEKCLPHAGELIPITAEDNPRLVAAVEELKRQAKAAGGPCKDEDLDGAIDRAERLLSAAVNEIRRLEGMPLDAGRQKQLSDRVASQVRRLSVVQVLTLTLR
jgi:hypothetical protein